MTDKIFAKGIRVKEIGQFGSIKLSINSAEIFDPQNGFDEASGWGNFIINKSKGGNLYIEVDKWKPNKNNNDNNVVEFNQIDEDELPF